MSPSWAGIRGAILRDPTVTYLNTGSYGLTPQTVFDQVSEYRRQLQMNPVDFIWRRGGPLLWEARQCLAGFLHAKPQNLMFTVNVTTAINIVAASLRLAAPGEILMTDHEYGAVRFAWERAAQRLGLNLRIVRLPIVPAEPRELVDAVVAAIRPETRLLFFSHVLYTTGMVMPVKAICAAARKLGVLTVVDGAHAPGMLPLDLDDFSADFYAANLHKWLLAPVGAGFLYSRPGNEDRLQPLVVSWGWHYDRTRADELDEFGGTPRLRAFEFEGSRDICPWLAVPAAIAFHRQVGPDMIRQRHRELTDHVRAQVDGVAGVQLVTPEHPGLRGGITAFRLPPVNLLEFKRRLWEGHRIEINAIEHDDGGFLRVSTHFYNLEAEVDRLRKVLPSVLA